MLVSTVSRKRKYDVLQNLFSGFCLLHRIEEHKKPCHIFAERHVNCYTYSLNSPSNIICKYWPHAVLLDTNPHYLRKKELSKQFAKINNLALLRLIRCSDLFCLQLWMLHSCTPLKAPWVELLHHPSQRLCQGASLQHHRTGELNRGGGKKDRQGGKLLLLTANLQIQSLFSQEGGENACGGESGGHGPGRAPRGCRGTRVRLC